ncbi:hypothetical protein QTG54_009350 [Skeletonema marinoi]|uniref:Uncharacterized protein n=1 Tax=Skeletonema marinoi TaxID=267567 RepID=A0AAD8Y6H5_9STRA|nr:hypothetical protein QTG54_009350 [Skeletonema marinoi]
MLMSIFELQGDGDIFRIRDVAKNSFDRFVSQAGEHLESEIPCHTKRKSLLKFITDTKRVTEKSDDADFEKAYPMMSKELHDLLIHELVDDGLPLLADIDRYFEKTKCIWNGWDKPQQGKMGATNEMAMYAQDRAAGENPAKKPTYSHAKIERTRQTSKRVLDHDRPC